MAEFSKQYCDKYDPGFPHDFDIDEIAKELKPSYQMPMICEGFGFSGIGKDKDGNVMVKFINYTADSIVQKWVLLSEVTNKTHREIWK